MLTKDDEEGNSKSKKSDRFFSSKGHLTYILSGFTLDVNPVTYSEGVIKAIDNDLNQVVFYTDRSAWYHHEIEQIGKGASGSKVSKMLMNTGCFPAFETYEFLLYDDALILEEESMLAGRFNSYVIDELSKHIAIKKDSELLEQKIITLDSPMKEIYGNEFTVQLREHDDKKDFVVGFNGNVARRTEIDVGKDLGFGRQFFGYLSDTANIEHLLRYQRGHEHQKVPVRDFFKEEHINKKTVLHYLQAA